MAILNTIDGGIRQARKTLPTKGDSGYDAVGNAAPRKTIDFPRMADNQRQASTCIRVRAQGLANLGLSCMP